MSKYDLTLTPDEAKSIKKCARWCAERNIVPNDGDPLDPDLQACVAIEWIRENKVRFRALVARERAAWLTERGMTE